MPCTATQMDLEIIILSKSEIDKYHIVLFTCIILKDYTKELISKTGLDPQAQNTNLWLPKGKGRREGGNWRRKWLPTPVFLPGESQGQRNITGYSPWGRKSQTRLSDFHYFYFTTTIQSLPYIKQITNIQQRELHSIFCNSLFGKRT